MSNAPDSSEVTGGGDSELERVYQAICAIPNAESLLCEGVSQAVDEVVDPVRSGRWEVAQLAQPEKTIIGIRVENTLRMALGLPRAEHLDVVVDGTNVDIKFTIGTNWTIPPEATGQLCLLARFEIRTLAISVGLLRTADAVLNSGRNRDQKRTLNAQGRESIRWIIQNEHPTRSVVGFLASIDSDLRVRLTDPATAAQERVNRLFLALKNKPIPETVVQAVAAPHVDWERRLRPDARNPNAPEQRGIDVLRSTSPADRRRIAALGLPPLPRGYCMAVDSA